MSADLSLLVLAAGRGSRFGGLKQLAPVTPAGLSILDFSLFDALRAGFTRIVLVIRPELEPEFRATLSQRLAPRTELLYAHQHLTGLPPGFAPPATRTKPWGTLQAVLAGLPLLPGPFAVINADDFYGPSSYQTLADHLRSASSHQAMVGFTLRNTLSDFGAVSRGLCTVSPEHHLLRVVETTHIVRNGDHAQSLNPSGTVTPLTGDEIVSMNMWGFTPAIAPAFHRLFQDFLTTSGTSLEAEAYLPAAVEHLLTHGDITVDVLPSHETWAGITYAEDLPAVSARLAQLTRQGLYPEHLWA